MNEPKPRENQQELFSDFVAEPRRIERIPSIAKTQKPILISTTLEQILLAGLVSILVFCLVFFLGVLRGRSLAPARLAVAPPPVAAQIPRALPAPVMIKKTTPPPAADNGPKPYTIQVLTTKKKNYAENEAALLKKSGFSAWAMASGDYYVVCVGSYAGKGDARKDLASFAVRYKDSYLRRK